MDSGLARRTVDFLRSREPTSEDWGIEIEEVCTGYARIRMRLTSRLLNGHGSAHGGIIFAFADTAFGYACNSRNELSVGAQASIVYLRPALAGDLLIAEARELGRSGRSGVYDVDIHTKDGRKIAVFRGYSRSLGKRLMEDYDIA